MQRLFLTIAFQFVFFESLLGICAAIILSFCAITLVTSYYRFQNILKIVEDTQPEEIGIPIEDVLQLQLARYLTNCNRQKSPFLFSLIHVEGASDIEMRMEGSFIKAIKRSVRREDTLCVFDGKTAALLIEAEAEDAEPLLARIREQIPAFCPEVNKEALRVGITSYPKHGQDEKQLIAAAQKGLKRTSVESPVFMFELAEKKQDADADDEKEEKHAQKKRKAGRVNILDELTGVLKPSVISTYMQRKMSELRRKKQPVTLFCIGIDNAEHIIRFHGADASDDVLVGVSRILQDKLRTADLIARHEKYAFLVLIQCSAEEAERIGKRLSTLVQYTVFVSGEKKIRTSVTLGIASSPVHGRKMHHLYTAGQKVLNYNRANDIRAYAVYNPEIHDKKPSKPVQNIKSVQA